MDPGSLADSHDVQYMLSRSVFKGRNTFEYWLMQVSTLKLSFTCLSSYIREREEEREVVAGRDEANTCTVALGNLSRCLK